MIPGNPQPDRLDEFLANVVSNSELATMLGVAIATLTDWRSTRKGPAYVKVGRKIWYLRDRVEQWLAAQVRETNHGNSEPRREVALPVQLRRQRVRRNNRLGRHQTKLESGTGNGVRVSGHRGGEPHRRGKNRSIQDLADQ